MIILKKTSSNEKEPIRVSIKNQTDKEYLSGGVRRGERDMIKQTVKEIILYMSFHILFDFQVIQSEFPWCLNE